MKILLILGACLLAACTGNTPQRDNKAAHCEEIKSCSNSYYEVHPNYEIGFVEYSERGNDFDPARTHELLERLKQYSAGGKVAVVVFIHGWKHNAKQDDENVVSFTKALANLARSGVLTDRKLVGVYVGWRGLSMHGLGTENLTYWDRKSVAEEVGRGGVTELLTQLEQVDRSRAENYLVIVGHSFGGAITLSALHDQLLERLQNQQAGLPVRAFGDAVIMVNPAIEANLGLLLKENSLKVGASGVKAQPLLYVISSEGDSATGLPFFVGQWLGVNLTWSQVDLVRNYGGKTFTLREETMDTTTIGNYGLFRTTLIRDPEDQKVTGKSGTEGISTKGFNAMASPNVIENTNFGEWELYSYCTANGNNGDPDLPRMPCYSNEPVNFIYTAESFIADHNDIFNPAVIAFMSASVSNAYYQTANVAFKECRTGGKSTGDFSFSACFDHHFALAKAMKKLQDSEEEAKNKKADSSAAYPESNKQKADAAI